MARTPHPAREDIRFTKTVERLCRQLGKLDVSPEQSEDQARKNAELEELFELEPSDGEEPAPISSRDFRRLLFGMSLGVPFVIPYSQYFKLIRE